MTNIVGIINKSGSETINGKLIVKLDAPLIETGTTPDTTHLPIEQIYTITSGVININLAESQTSNVTYQFKVLRTVSQTFYYFASNNQAYFGEVHVYTDGLTYTGATHTSQSQLLIVGNTTTDEILDSFHAIVPNVSSIEFSQLRDTGITTDTLDTSQRRIAEILKNDQDFIDSIKPRYLGEYSPGTYYGYTDSVSYNGSSWIYINSIPTAGNTPTEPSIYWAISGRKGDPGGTGGIDTPYDATGWNGSLIAPSQNAIRDIIENLARRNGDTLTNPQFNTQPVSDVSLKGANTTFVDLKITDRFSDAVLGTGATVVTQNVTDSSAKPASTLFVKLQSARVSRVIDSKTVGTGGGNSVVGLNIRAFNIAVGADITNLSSNVLTLRAGSYRVRGRAPAYAVTGNHLILWNNSVGYTLVQGESNFTPAGVQNYAHIDDEFVLATPTDVLLYHWCAAAITGGLGGAVNHSGFNEIYSVLTFTRID